MGYELCVMRMERSARARAEFCGRKGWRVEAGRGLSGSFDSALRASLRMTAFVLRARSARDDGVKQAKAKNRQRPRQMRGRVIYTGRLPC